MTLEATNSITVGPIVKETFKTADVIIFKYHLREGSRSEARKDAFSYVQAEHNYVTETNNPADLEYSNKLGGIIERANRGCWSPMKKFLKSLGDGILETDIEDVEWRIMGESLINLSESI